MEVHMLHLRKSVSQLQPQLESFNWVRISIAVIFLSAFVASCRNHSTEPFDYTKDTPAWLKDKVTLMSSDTAKFYAKTTVYRYSWHSDYVYYISIPLSSCMYCEVYDQTGQKLKFSSDAMLQDFLNNRSDEIIVWQSNL